MIVASRRRAPGELTFVYGALLFSLFLFSEAYEIAGFSSVSSAGVFPLFATGLMVITSLVSIVRTHRLQSAMEPGLSVVRAFRRQVIPLNFIVFASLTILYAVALNPLGFLLSTFLFVSSSILYLHQRRIVVAVGVSLGATALIYLVFRVAFEVVLPKGWVFG